jgi:hypothetical protein
MGKRVVGVGHYKLPGEDAIPIDGTGTSNGKD